jgi:PadR family transcriptional regulator, regulatory protein PadR
MYGADATSEPKFAADSAWLPAAGAVLLTSIVLTGENGLVYASIVSTGKTMQLRQDSGDLLQGTLGILILKSLFLGAAHGYAIARWIEETTGDVLRIEEGSLYPALRRLEDRGWVTSEWGLSENNRRARYYTITAAGRKHLRTEATVWLRYSQAVTRVLRAAPAIA